MTRLALVFLTIPAVTAFVGWLTNWAAVRMIFGPEHFVGVGPVGWQGVVPRRADQFAHDVAVTMTDNVLTADELVERVDPGSLVVLLRTALDDQAEALTRDVLEAIQSGLWAELFEPVREALVDEIRTEAERSATELLARLDEGSEDLVDIQDLVADMLSGDNTHRLVRLTQEVGREELRFIVWSGAGFGLLIGLAQAAAFQVFDQWWLMPAVGAAVGLVTNWLAIQMIFRPVEPIRLFGIGYQGLFPKRQPEIAADYGRIAGEEILTPANLVRYLTSGERGDRLATEVITAVERQVERQLPAVEPLASTSVTPELTLAVRDVVLTRIVTAFESVRPELERHLEERLGVADIVEGKLAAMDKPQFERVLRGIFEEDEIILVVIGGFLGATVGLLQGAIVLGASL